MTCIVFDKSSESGLTEFERDGDTLSKALLVIEYLDKKMQKRQKDARKRDLVLIVTN